ncbi:hypothetical protein HN873_047583, partial [Arachis hypogaea]
IRRERNEESKETYLQASSMSQRCGKRVRDQRGDRNRYALVSKQLLVTKQLTQKKNAKEAEKEKEKVKRGGRRMKV